MNSWQFYHTEMT